MKRNTSKGRKAATSGGRQVRARTGTKRPLTEDELTSVAGGSPLSGAADMLKVGMKSAVTAGGMLAGAAEAIYEGVTRGGRKPGGGGTVPL